MESQSKRTLSEIARDIRKEWKKVYFGAVPYLNAMSTMREVSDSYGCDDGRSIVNYFLANASAFRGESARKLKAELKAML